MNKRVIIAASAAAAVTLTSLAFYSSGGRLEVAFPNNDITCRDFWLRE